MFGKKSFLKEIEEKMKKEKSSLAEMLRGFADKDQKLSHDWDTRFPRFNGSHLEEAADEVEEYENLLPVEHTLETKLKDINLALEKIKKGDYGRCEKCRKFIPQERLKISPESKFCLKCSK